MTDPCSAHALDGHVFRAYAVAAARLDAGAASGDLLGIDFAERCRLAEFAGLAIGTRHRLAAIRSARQALVDAIAVALVLDDENPGFGAGLYGSEQQGNDRCRDCEDTHGDAGMLEGAEW